MALEECIAMYYGFYYFTVNNFYYWLKSLSLSAYYRCPQPYRNLCIRQSSSLLQSSWLLPVSWCIMPAMVNKLFLHQVPTTHSFHPHWN
jgi:hypothetical protein